MSDRRAPTEVVLLLSSSQQTVFYEEPTLLREGGLALPLSIFSSSLSGLQAIVRYLHDHRQLSFSEIAVLLNRSEKTIWSSYQQGKDAPFAFVEEGLTVPVELFALRDLSVLETLVDHLSGLGFSNVESARLLRLDPRTTWTVARRIAKKREVRP